MYSHLEVLESKGVWSSGKVKYPIILVSYLGDIETVIDTKRVLNERSQMIFEVPDFSFFPPTFVDQRM